MRAVRLLESAIALKPETVLDVGVGLGNHSMSFLANGATVTGIDLRESNLQHTNYTHLPLAFEQHDFKDQKFDLIWCSHVLEHIPNVGMFLIKLRHLLKDGGHLFISVPTDRQQRLHIGHLTLWTPAHLVYNMICAGWDCRLAKWYTEYCTIGLTVQKTADISFEGRTGMPSEVFWVNEYAPRSMKHECGAWWGNNWPDETGPRVSDPPSVTIGQTLTDLPPEQQAWFGPNPELRKKYEKRENRASNTTDL